MQENEAALEARQKFVSAFNDTMVTIWQERITLLGVIDTSALLHSPIGVTMHADGRFMDITLSQQFLEYGLWQDYGTGRETPRGNGGDIGREKKRKRRRWFSKKYYASIMKLRDFYAENLGYEFTNIFANAFHDRNFRRVH